MSTPFEWARQAGIRLTGGFAVVAECVTLDELARFAQIAISQDRSSAPQIAINPEVIGYVAPQREWKGLTEEEIDKVQLQVILSMDRGKLERDGRVDGRLMYRAIEQKLMEKNT